MHCYAEDNSKHYYQDCTQRVMLVQDERMQSMMEDMRGKFKAVAAMLGVLEDYFPCQSTSKTESLSF